MARSFYIVFFIIFIVIPPEIFSQAGSSVYSFLDLPVSSRIGALGGTNVSLRDNDINFAFKNPAMLTNETGSVISINMASYLADIKYGSAVFGYNIDKKNYLAIGVQYVDYGDFLYADEYNNIRDAFLEEYQNNSDISGYYFTAKDMSLNMIYARSITDRITVGGTLKPIFSVYEAYTSFGIAFDAGVNYIDSKGLFSAGFVLRNMGSQIKGYYSTEDGQHYESLPFDIQLGVTKKLEHAPLRLSMTLHNLQHWNLNYSSKNQSTSTGDSISFTDMAFRHAIFSAEFVPSKNFYLIASYNHRRHQELSMDGFKSMAGFSFGGGIKLYKFQVGFGMSQFQLGVYSYQFSISTSLNEFRL
ncbi:MAG: type IX secretion system protein PorQ [Paludibacter sp.]|nr:type IX secretion system protein PorQ [Paludibacter sp.]